MAATAAVTGSITVCHALIPSGLVDEYGLFVYPVVLSRTRRLLFRRLQGCLAESRQPHAVPERRRAADLRRHS